MIQIKIEDVEKGSGLIEDKIERHARHGVGVNLTEPEARDVIRTIRALRELRTDCMSVLEEAQGKVNEANGLFWCAAGLTGISAILLVLALIA